MSRIYLILSIIIAAVVIVDGIYLRKVEGKLDVDSFLAITSTIEFIWVIVSFIIFVEAIYTDWRVLIPVSYVVYNVIGWLYGLVMLTKPNKDPFADNHQDIHIPVVPVWSVNLGITFGAVFGLTCLVAIIV